MQTPTPWMHTPHPPLNADPPECRPPPDAEPQMQTPLDADPPGHVTHACENITLPQTSFAGGKYYLPATSLIGNLVGQGLF